MSARVAVIIPCFQEGPLVIEAARSVNEDEPVEIVVIDDGSRDEPTARALDELRGEGVSVVTHGTNKGLIAARMTGVASSSAPYIFSLDADDLAMPGVLAGMADMLDADDGAAVCFGDYEEFGDVNEVRVIPHSLDPFRVAYWNEYPVSAMFRRTVLERVDGWRARGRTEGHYEDWHLWMTLAEEGERGIHFGDGRVTFRHRWHGTRMFDDAKSGHAEFYPDLKRYHPQLFAELGEHRRRSSLGPVRKLLYPVVYGERKRRYGWEPTVRRALTRIGIFRRQR